MSNTSESTGESGFLSGLRGLFRGEGKGDEPAKKPASEFTAVRDEFNSTMKSLQDKIAAHRASLERKNTVTTGGPAKSSVADERAAQLKKEFEESKRSILAEIEALHKSLKTGIEASALPGLREYLLSIAEQIEVGRSGGIEERLRGTALVTVFRHAGEIAWEELNSLMTKSGEQWPDPHELSRNATEVEISLARERSLSEIRELFLTSSSQVIGELVVGVVPAWKISYPPKSSWLWKQVTLRSVAAGIQAQLAKAVITELRSEGESIRKEITGLLSKELSALNAAVSSAGASIDDADKLVRTASGALEGLVKELILQRAAPIFERLKNS